MTTKFAYGTQTTIQIVAHWCNGCGIPYGLPEGFIEDRRRDHKSWTCPNGCVRLFRKDPDVEEQLKRQARNAEAQATALKDQLEAAVRETERTKATLLRDRQRIANGVCPCCNRTFQNVLRHMQGQHPDYDVSKVQQAATPEFKCSCRRTFRSIGGLHQHQTKQRRPGWAKPTTDPWMAHLTVV